MLPDRVTRLLTAYVDGELTPHQQRAVLRLVNKSIEARTFLHEMQHDAELVRQLPRKMLPPEFADRVLRRIGDEFRRPLHPTSRIVGSPVPLSWGLAAAAAVLLVVGLSCYFFLFTLQAEKRAADNDRTDQQYLADKQAQPAHVERLGQSDPVVENTVNPSPDEPQKPRPATTVVKDTRKKDLSPSPPETVEDTRLLSPSQNPEGELEKVDLKVALVLRIRELKQADARQQLDDQLRKSAAHRIELSSAQPSVAARQLLEVFKAQGIHVLVDQYAQSCLDVRGLEPTSYTFYTETLTVPEVCSLLQRLNGDEHKSGPQRIDKNAFDSLVVNGMTDKDKGVVARLLGVNKTELDSPRKQLPESNSTSARKMPQKADPRRPLALATEEEVVRALKNRVLRSDTDRLAIKPGERLAVLMACKPARPWSREIQAFRENRKDRTPGQISLLFVMRAKN